MSECQYCRRGDTNSNSPQVLCEHCKGTGNEPTPMTIEVWACPNPECGAYFAASGAGNLAEKPKVDYRGAKRGSRADCGYCKTTRERILTTIYVPVREEAVSARNA